MNRNIVLLLCIVSAALPLAACSAEIVRVSAPGHIAFAPDIAIDDNGAVNILWLDKGTQQKPVAQPHYAGEGHSHMAAADVLVARSTDGGKTFTAPVRSTPRQRCPIHLRSLRPAEDLSSRGMPRRAANDGSTIA